MRKPTMIRLARFLFCAALATAAIACRPPMQLRPNGASDPMAHETRRSASGNEGLVMEIAKPVPLARHTSESNLPDTLIGKPHGQVGFTIKWPEQPKNRATQAIPNIAHSLRLRVVGNDGSNRLVVHFFRADASEKLTQSQNFFLPVESGLLIEVRAYQEKLADLTKMKDVVPAIPGFKAEPPYNPATMSQFDVRGKRVLAEGFQFNQQVSLLSSTPVKIELDTSQLVAGIGGTAGTGGGGDPFIDNYVSPARFAELWDPRGVMYDRARSRLFWFEFPIHSAALDPKERDVIRMLNTNGVGGNMTDSAASVIFQIAGGNKVETGGAVAVPSGEARFYAPLPVQIAWSKRNGAATLYLAQASDSVTVRPSNVLTMSPVEETALPSQIGGAVFINGVRDFVSVSPAISDTKPLEVTVLAVDRSVQAIRSSKQTDPNTFIAGGNTASEKATPSASVIFKAEKTVFTRLKAVATRTEKEFVVQEGNSIIRCISGSMLIIAGSGTIEPVTTDANQDAQALGFADVRGVVYDPINTNIIYVIDNVQGLLHKITMPNALVGQYRCKSIAIASPKALTISPLGGRAYVLDTSGVISEYVDSTGTTGSINMGNFATATSIACGRFPFRQPETGDSVDQLIFAYAGNVTTKNVNSASNAPESNLFAGGSLDIRHPIIGSDILVGDGVNLTRLSGVTGPKFSDTAGDFNNLTKPTAMAVDATGDIYVADTGNNRIRRIRMSGNVPQSILSLVRSGPDATVPYTIVDTPQGLDVDEYGNVFISDTNNSKIVAWRPCMGLNIDRSPPLQAIAGTGQRGVNFDNINANLVQLSSPKIIKVERKAKDPVSPRRRVFFIDQGNRVRMLTPFKTAVNQPGSDCDRSDPYFQYIISTIAGAGTGGDGANAAQAKLDEPVDLDIDKNGYVYIADGAKLRRVDAITGSISTIYTAPNKLTSISIDDNLNELYFTMVGQQSIRKVLLSN